MHIGFFACFHAISLERSTSFQQNWHIIFLALRNLIRPRCAERAKPGRGKPVGFLICFHAISLATLFFSRGPPLPKRAYEISNLPKDFKISAKISDFS